LADLASRIIFSIIKPAQRSATLAAAILVGVAFWLVPAPVAPQTPEATSPRQEQGGFPDASFEAIFRKYSAPKSPFSPFYAWDAHMALNLTVFRKGRGAVTFRSTFQTVGTQNLGPKVSVGGTGYLLGIGYLHAYSDAFRLSGGIAHLSSHLTRDLDEKVQEERDKGAGIPIVVDPSEYNVFYFKLYGKISAWPFAPELEMVIEPINFSWDGSDAGYVRPVYLSTRSTVWRGNRKAMLAETQHEIGRNAFNSFSLSFALYARNQQEGRLQIFVSATPGQNMHVSPHIGGLRDGIAFGVRMRFRT
jgi:hypothetical protein